MKKYVLSLLALAMGGCTLHNSPYRLAEVSLAKDGQPCVAVPVDSMTKDRKSRLLVLRVSERFADKQMHLVWQRDDMKNPTFIVQPGKCLPVHFRFEKGKEYSVNVITAFSAREVETKRIWSTSFTLEKPANKK